MVKKINWRLTTYHPLTNNTIGIDNVSSIKELADKYPAINQNTWRNIACGRSKVYDKFLLLEKVSQEENKDKPMNDYLKEEYEKPSRDSNKNLDL